MPVDEEFKKVELQPDQFGGLIGNLGADLLRNQIGGHGGDIIGGLLSGNSGGNAGFGSGGSNNVGNLLGNLIGGGGGFGGGGSQNRGGGGGSFDLNDIAGVIGGLSGNRNQGGGYSDAGPDIGSIGNLIGGLIGGGGDRGKYSGGGSNVPNHFLSGGVSEMIGNLIGEAAHRFLGVNPQTGKIIGAVAGNVIYNLGGKDNKLSNIGKVILDNIISGKFKRPTDPYVKPEPVPAPTPIRRGEALDFYAERDRCLNSRTLFEDPDFPANNSSLFYSRQPPKHVEWLRPGEIVKDPQLISEGHSRFDAIQGELGDCYLMSAAADLTLRGAYVLVNVGTTVKYVSKLGNYKPCYDLVQNVVFALRFFAVNRNRHELFYRVVPPDQSFTDNYAGIFHFQFWQYGRWIDVVIDDRLPTSNGELLYMHSRENNEAYAKLYGSYEALKGGTTSEVLEDFTGGLTEFYDLQQAPENLLQLIVRGFEMSSMFGCSLEADPHQWEARLPNGLIRGHAYSITGVRVVDGPRGRTPLLRIRNPWGNEQEWNGSWSDNSSEWSSIPESVKKDMGLVFAHDGEFWMSFDDFMRNFEKMEVCNLGPDVQEEVFEMTGVKSNQNVWAVNSHDGSWRAGSTAGGCRNYLRTFANNPQFRIKLTDRDPDDDDDLCTVIVAVMQKHRRELKNVGVENLAIGFAMYEANRVTGRLGTDFFANNKSCGRSPAFINLREVTGRFRVPPGEYVIVPSTYEPNEEGDFMLRVYTSGVVESEEL
ncbi:Calpain family cysteine protease [Aphelenchoides besseyi]|nr:Calpain family cysteine protease [Aphelenchoides besseyi]